VGSYFLPRWGGAGRQAGRRKKQPGRRKTFLTGAGGLFPRKSFVIDMGGHRREKGPGSVAEKDGRIYLGTGRPQARGREKQ